MIADPDLFSNLKLPDGVNRDLVIDTIIEKHGMTALVHPNPDWMKHYIGVWSSRRLLGWKRLYNTTQMEYNPIENYDRKEDVTDQRTTDSSTTGQMTGTTSASVTGENNGKTSTSNSIDVDETHEDETQNSSQSNQTTDKTAENKGDVSAENASDYQPDSRSTDVSKDQVSGTSSTSSNNSGERSQTTSENGSQTVEETSKQSTSEESKQSSSGSQKVTDTYTHTNRTHGNIGVTTTQQMLESERELVRYSLIEEIAEDYRDAFCLMVY